MNYPRPLNLALEFKRTMDKKELPPQFLETLTNKITDHVFSMPDDATEDHVVVNDKFEIEFVPVKNQIEKPWHRIGTVGSLNQNIPLMGGVRIAEPDNEIYELDDGLNEVRMDGEIHDKHKLVTDFPEGNYKRTYIDSSFTNRAGLIEHLKTKAVKEAWYERMITLTKSELGIKDEDEDLEL